MTVAELIEQLKTMDPDAELRLATQPNWPLAYYVGGIRTQADIDVEQAYEDLERGDVDEHTAKYGIDEDGVREHAEQLVWIVEGGSVWDKPYAPRQAWNDVSCY